MKKTVSLLTSLFHVALDNARHQVETYYTEDMASKTADAIKEVSDVAKEIERVLEAEKKEFIDFQKFYEASLNSFSKFMQAEIEKRFEKKEEKKPASNGHDTTNNVVDLFPNKEA